MIHYQQLQQLQVNISLNNPFIIERDTYEQFIEVDATLKYRAWMTLHHN
jgi:hypothetical protein